MGYRMSRPLTGLCTFLSVGAVALSNTLNRAHAAPANAQCPTRFDYLVLSSLADSPALLSLSSFRFRSQLHFSDVPLTGLQRVTYTQGGDACVGSRAGALAAS